MPEEENKSELKSEIAKAKPRDEEGHFVHAEPPNSNPSHSSNPSNPLTQFLGEHTHYSKSKDDLLDIHVGNPLRRITNILEEIRKQKAFSFTLKGSLGIMGVFLALSVFGIFGGGKILCDRGIQSEIGTIKTLQVLDSDPSTIPMLSFIIDYFAPKQMHNRTVLVKDNATVIRLPYSRNIDMTKFVNYPVYPEFTPRVHSEEQSRRVIATGNYDSCSQTLSVNDPSAIEIYTNTLR